MSSSPSPGRRRVDAPSDATPGRAHDLVLGMLARGIPLTLLPDLAWPEIASDADACPGSPWTAA